MVGNDKEQSVDEWSGNHITGVTIRKVSIPMNIQV